jgi:hypothetical protein
MSESQVTIGGNLYMATVEDLDQVIEQCQRALNEFLKGNPEPNKAMFSHREDVTLLNPEARVSLPSCVYRIGVAITLCSGLPLLSA